MKEVITDGSTGAQSVERGHELAPVMNGGSFTSDYRPCGKLAERAVMGKAGVITIEDIYRSVQELRKTIDELNERFNRIEEYIESQPQYISRY